jgi:hypothetical protein
MPLILGANSLTGGYEVDNSLRFNTASSDNLTKTGTTGDSRRIFTHSVWVKKCDNSTTDGNMIINSAINENNQFYIELEGSSPGDDNDIRIRQLAGGSVNTLIKTSASFRDVSAWYHIVVAVDTTQATASNRIKLYVNGSQITAFDSSTYPSQNTDMEINTTSYTNHIGKRNNSSAYFNGYMSEFNFIDGQQLAPSDFGEFDEDSGIWKPIAYEGTYGTNGFFLEFKDSSALGDDTSGEGNDFTVNNLTSIDQTTDTPTNNFPILNSIWGDDISAGSMTYSNGNTTYQPTTNGNSYTRSTFGMSNKGKWYAEMKVTEVNTGQSASLTVTPDTNFGASTDSGYGFQVQLNAANTVLNKVVGGTATSINNSFASGSIAMLAVDLDNGKMWVGYNGTWYNDNNPSSTLDVSNPDGTGISTSYDYIYGFQAYWQTGGYYDIADVNFGNPSFAISSGNSDANGYGNFEYEVPSGYYALCTKNLAEYG